MLPLEPPDRIHVAFDDHRLVANAGLLLPVTLARHLKPLPEALTGFGLNTQIGQLTPRLRFAGGTTEGSSTCISTTGISSCPTTCTTRMCWPLIGAIPCPTAVASRATKFTLLLRCGL